MPTKKEQSNPNVQFHRLSKTKKQKTSWGAKGVLFSDWDELKLNGLLIDFTSETPYSEWGDSKSENLCIVEDGQGVLTCNGKEYPVKKGFAFKIFPGQNPVVKPKTSLTFLSVQKPSPESTISGKGWTYAEPNLYEMSEDTFTLFPKGITHTNGPVPGEIFRIYAIQMPWVESKIDEENIAGAPKFVKYVGTVPPKKLWKTKQDFLNVINRLSK